MLTKCLGSVRSRDQWTTASQLCHWETHVQFYLTKSQKRLQHSIIHDLSIMICIKIMFSVGGKLRDTLNMIKTADFLEYTGSSIAFIFIVLSSFYGQNRRFNQELEAYLPLQPLQLVSTSVHRGVASLLHIHYTIVGDLFSAKNLERSQHGSGTNLTGPHHSCQDNDHWLHLYRL